MFSLGSILVKYIRCQFYTRIIYDSSRNSFCTKRVALMVYNLNSLVVCHLSSEDPPPLLRLAGPVY